MIQLQCVYCLSIYVLVYVNLRCSGWLRNNKIVITVSNVCTKRCSLCYCLEWHVRITICIVCITINLSSNTITDQVTKTRSVGHCATKGIASWVYYFFIILIVQALTINSPAAVIVCIDPYF